MDLGGTYEVKAPKERVFDFITDPEKIGKCLPDLRSLEMEGEDRFTAIMRIGIGFVKSEFTFRVGIVEKKFPVRVRLKGNGTGTGSEIDVDINIELSDTTTGSRFVYKADVQLSGMLAAISQRLVMRMVEKAVNQMFSCISHEIE